jgi:1-acyl-sn-glycerol-3-phosphate acyltransferase
MSWAAVRFLFFWLMTVVQLPVIFFLPRGAIGYMKFFMRITNFIFGIRIRVKGRLADQRPLMILSNHISIFECATFPVAVRCGFFGKKEIESYPLIGWVARKFGVIFVDRRPSQATHVLGEVHRAMSSVKYPMVLFPEGTSTNGAYVKRFKSSLFNVIEGSDLTVQPLVLNYRHRDGSVISDEDLAQHYAFFNNRDMDCGPHCLRERPLLEQMLHVMAVGGLLVEITVLPPVPVKGMDRKQIAETLHKIISDKYMELKDKSI